MKKLRFIFVLAILAFLSRGASAQFTAGARFSGHSAILDQHESDDPLTISAAGIGPYFNLESKRFIMNLSFNYYFSSYSATFDGVNSTGSIRFKPNEVGILFGYKINANKPLKFYPALGINKYTIGIEFTEKDASGVLIIKDQANLYGISLGVGSYYNYGNFVFDLQAKISAGAGFYAGEEMFGPQFTFGFGVGYQFSKKE